MHARANTPDGVMCHTISTTSWRSLWFNDDCVGETGINAAICGFYDCPVVLVTGDRAVCRESRELLGDNITTDEVKQVLSRRSARQIPPVRARRMIEAGAHAALTGNLAAIKPYKPGDPCTITVDLPNVERAEDFRSRPGVEIEAADMKAISRADTWMQAWNQIWR